MKQGLVSKVGSEAGVPVTILRGTGPFDSFILTGVLPLSEESATGICVPVK